jgi:2-C-methyl-D-erythritol 2,4-cyclodiphosphate synthase
MPRAVNRKPETEDRKWDDAFRIGFGSDLHRLVAGRKLILGGLRIPFGKGPLGHSDGDALTHAVCDALLGAAALGDIGRHFPDSSPEWKDASSLEFLRHVRGLIDEQRLAIINVDATVEIEQPRLAPHIERIRAKMARALGIQTGQMSIKAKSGEGVGEVGRGEIVRAEAVVLLRRR